MIYSTAIFDYVVLYKRMMKKTLLSALLAASISLTGCSTISNLVEKPDEDKTVAEFYEDATEAFASEQWDVAIEEYEKLKAYFPYGNFAEQSYLELAYAYYRYDEPESAIRELEEFMRLFPKHQELPYAYYLRALAADSITRSWLDKFITDPASRDTKSADRAYGYYVELINRYPNTDYARQASKRLLILRNQMARHQVQVAQFYLEREAYLAAVNRARRVLEEYPNAAETGEAIRILAYSYDKMGMTQNRDDALKVYTLNQDKFKVSRSTDDDMEDLANPNRSYWDRFVDSFKGLFGG
ncbi:outer membrane protein assembly factor BamD [Thiomicrorhabdus marina]|nr:outer membrane protein assembly factor BamD [Thiomicrorhabdus marina]